MAESLSGKPVSWDPPSNWRERAKRIASLLRSKQEAVRLIGVAGDYAQGAPDAASVLTLVVFFHDWRPDYTLGAVQSMEEMPVALDWVTDAYFVDIEMILNEDVRAHRLATLQPLVTRDRIVRDLLIEFRDRYFGAEERERRTQRLLDRALERLSGYERDGLGVGAVEAFLWGYGPALCHAVDEAPSRRRLLQRFADAARVRRLRPLVADTVAAFGLDAREPASVLAAVERLRTLAEAHTREWHNEAIGGLLPHWASELAKARRAAAVLEASGAPEAAVFAGIAAGAAIDALTEREAPGFRQQPDYAEAAGAIYGAPELAPLRHVVYEIRAALR